MVLVVVRLIAEVVVVAVMFVMQCGRSSVFSGKNLTIITLCETVDPMITVDLASHSSHEQLGQLGLCPDRFLNRFNLVVTNQVAI